MLILHRFNPGDLIVYTWHLSEVRKSQQKRLSQELDDEPSTVCNWTTKLSMATGFLDNRPLHGIKVWIKSTVRLTQHGMNTKFHLFEFNVQNKEPTTLFRSNTSWFCWIFPQYSRQIGRYRNENNSPSLLCKMEPTRMVKWLENARICDAPQEG